MLLFSTKRDINGNRYYLAIDHERKEYTREPRYFHKEDFVEIGKRDRAKIIEALDKDGFKEVDTLGR